MSKSRLLSCLAVVPVSLLSLWLYTSQVSSVQAADPKPAAGGNELHKDWKLVLDQDFSKLKELDKKIWNVIDKGDGFGNGELQYYSPRPENLKIDNGELVITGKKEAYKGKQYTSAKITTEGKWSVQYGRIEACIKAPKGQAGNWPAFWMLGNNIGSVGWPKCGEIDIMEVINKEDTLFATMHFAGGQKQCKYSLGGGKNFSEDYHVYAVEWEKGEIRSYCDGIYFGKAVVDKPFDQNFFIILNYAIGGQWPKNPDGSSTFPQEMHVKYIRVYASPDSKVQSK